MEQAFLDTFTPNNTKTYRLCGKLRLSANIYTIVLLAWWKLETSNKASKKGQPKPNADISDNHSHSLPIQNRRKAKHFINLAAAIKLVRRSVVGPTSGSGAAHSIPPPVPKSAATELIYITNQPAILLYPLQRSLHYSFDSSIFRSASNLSQALHISVRPSITKSDSASKQAH